MSDDTRPNLWDLKAANKTKYPNRGWERDGYCEMCGRKVSTPAFVEVDLDGYVIPEGDPRSDGPESQGCWQIGSECVKVLRGLKGGAVMTRTLRTQHSSYVDLDPTEYEYVSAFDTEPEPGSFIGDGGEWEMPDGSLVEGTNFANAEYHWHRRLLQASATSIWDESGQCDHCGARLRYVVIMKHLPTTSHIAIGETCFAERFDYDDKVTKDLDRLRKLAKQGRERTRVAARHQAWLDADPRHAEVEAFLTEDRGDSERLNRDSLGGFEISLLSQLNRKGELTERQVEAALKGRDRRNARLARAAVEAETAVPVVAGSGIVVEGEVLSAKSVDGGYGPTLKMLVRDDRGFKVWGSVPSVWVEIPDPYRPDGDETSTTTTRWLPERGERVRFTANIEASHDDETFGFFKRPRKAEVLSA